MRRVNFHLTEKEIKGLDVVTETTGIGKAEHIRRAVDEYLTKKKWEGVTGLQELDL